MALPKLSTGALNIYADPLLGSATSPTTSPAASSKPEDSDPNYTLNYEEPVIASVRAYMEVRHASPAWVNRAAYTKADLLFRIRAIPGVKITEAMQISSARGRCVIDAVEPIGRYLQILAHRTEAEGTL